MPRLRLILAASLLMLAGVTHADDWPGFRGVGGASVSETVSPPVDWSVDTGTNVAWSADLPGTGVSSPIVVDGRVIVTAASGADRDRLHVLAFDSMTGKPLWHRQFWATGRTLCYRTSSVAAPTRFPTASVSSRSTLPTTWCVSTWMAICNGCAD